MPDPAVKLCRDCKHAERDNAMPWCENPATRSSVDDLVHGADKPMKNVCRTARLPTQPCGPEGKLWEPR